jgi:dihydroorotase
MKLLLRKATVLDASSDFHGQSVDLIIDDGKIVKIGTDLNVENATVITSDNLHVSIGWMDVGAVATDPGLEYKETLDTLRLVAAAGGFTDITTTPNTKPIVQDKSTIHYLKQGNSCSTVNIHPMAAITVNCEGKDFTEMMDLQRAGAIAFTDGLNPLWNADILLKTLLYLQPINGVLINRPEEPTLAFMGQMNEGIMSTQLGMKGIPETAEELMIMRDLELLTYADIRSENPVLHFSKVSTINGLKRIKEAKVKGLAVSCDVSVNQLLFTEDDISTFDSNYKVTPPLRNEKTIKALKKGLADGTVDLLISDHHPHDEESKKLTFDDAEFGIIGLQTLFPNALLHSGLNLENLITKLTENPRKLLRLNVPTIAEGETIPLTVFDPETRWIFNEKTNKSTALNSPLLGKELTGTVLATVNNGHVHIN